MNKKKTTLLLFFVATTGFLGGVFASQLTDAKKTASTSNMTKEDLSATKLPHGELVLPDRNNQKGRQGYILKISDLKFSNDPFKKERKQAGSPAKFFERLRKEKTGDLFYSSLNGGTLCSVSGRMKDLGKHHLYEFDGKKLSRPPEVEGTEERSSKGEGTPGVIEGIHNGHCYLIETVDKKYVLLRVVQIQKQDRSALIQYVYQSDGGLVFKISQGKLEKVAAPRSSSIPVFPTPPPSPTVEGKVTDLSSLMTIREKMIKELMKVVEQPARTKSEIAGKARAIHVLGNLRASEAASLLVREIDFFDPYLKFTRPSREYIPPWAQDSSCVDALQSIGKPASLAALEAIKSTSLKQPTKKIRMKDVYQSKELSPLYLKTRVLLRVEGKDVAHFIIVRQLRTAKPEEKNSLEFALHIIKGEIH